MSIKWRSKENSNRHIVVYISAPLTAPTTSEWWDNVMEARSWCKILWEEGLTPICPHLNSLFMEGIIPYKDIMEGCLELVSRSDAVLMRGEWEDSKGCRSERHFAKGTKVPVFEHMSDLFEWVENRPSKYNEEEL